MRAAFLILLLLSVSHLPVQAQNQIWKAVRMSTGQFAGGMMGGAKDDAAGIALGDAIYVMGGTDNYTVFNTMFVSSDKGKTWAQMPDAPWEERNAVGIAAIDGKIKIWGGNSDKVFVDSWEFDPVNGWKQIADDMGAVYSNRKSFAFVFTGSEFITIGGMYHDDVIASNDLTAGSWTVRGKLPQEMQNTGGITACYFNGAIYLTSGRNTVTGEYPGRVYRSTDAGATWEVVYNDQAEGTSIFTNKWGNIVATNTAMIYIKGTTGETGGTNEKGCYWSVDGANWTRMNYEPGPRHATTVFSSADGKEAFAVMGNFYNDSWIFRQIDNVDQEIFLDEQCAFRVPDLVGDDLPDVSGEYFQYPVAGTLVSSVAGKKHQVAIYRKAGQNLVKTNEFFLMSHDTLPPVVGHPGDTILVVKNSCSYVIPDLSDRLQILNECDEHFITQTPAAGTRMDFADSVLVSFAVKDASGNQASAFFYIFLKNMSQPVIEQPEELHVSADPGKCEAIIEILPPSSFAGCETLSLTAERSDDLPLTDPFALGTTTIRWTTETKAGLRAEVDQIVTVADTEKPLISAEADLLFCPLPENHYQVPAITASDNCGIAAVSFVVSGATNRSGSGADASGFFNLGYSRILWKVIDVNGNVSTALTRVQVRSVEVVIADVQPIAPGTDPNTLYPGYGPDSVVISASVSNGLAPYSFIWNTGDTSSFVYAKVSSGSMEYLVEVTDARGCTNIASIYIGVKEVRCGPALENISVCRFENGVLTTHCVSAEAAAIYLASGAVLGNCAINFSKVRTQIDAAEVRNNLHVLSAPNPSSNHFNIKVESFEPSPVLITITNGLGIVMERKSVQPGAAFQVGSHYPAGLYVLEARQGNERSLFKLVKRGN